MKNGQFKAQKKLHEQMGFFLQKGIDSTGAIGLYSLKCVDEDKKQL